MSSETGKNNKVNIDACLKAGAVQILVELISDKEDDEELSTKAFETL